MSSSRSPWLSDFTSDRSCRELIEDAETDVAIIGGGISGIATAYHVLTRTGGKVVLLEKSRVGRGASGHGSGQVVAAFEKDIDELIATYGVDLVLSTLKHVSAARRSMSTMAKEAGLIDTPRIVRATVGISSKDDLDWLRGWASQSRKTGLQAMRIKVSKESRWVRERQNDPFVQIVPEKDVRSILAQRTMPIRRSG